MFVPSCGLHDADEVRQKLGPRRVVVSVSGGKDSVSCCLYLKQMGIPYVAVFQDTGWEHESTYQHLRQVLPRFIGPVLEIRSSKYPEGMAQMVVERGRFPTRLGRFCTQELKVFPMRDYLSNLHRAGIDTVNVVGIRAEESAARAVMPEWEDSPFFDCEVWRPLIKWTTDDVIGIHRHYDVPPAPLYLRGAERLGCWPCIFARKSEIRMVAEISPARIALISMLEEEVAKKAIARYAEQGETLESRGYVKPAWFTDRVNQKSGRPVPIAEAVAWAMTPTRGKEPEPFDDPMRECVRWGMCEANRQDPEVEAMLK